MDRLLFHSAALGLRAAGVLGGAFMAGAGAGAAGASSGGGSAAGELRAMATDDRSMLSSTI
jgi:hypothetical protein